MRGKVKVGRAGALLVMAMATNAGAGVALAHDPPPAGAAALVLEATGSELTQECSQFAMNLPANAASVRPYVPRRFVFSRDIAGKAVLGYRAFECRSLRMNDGPPRRVTWTELGVRILPPEGLPEAHADQHVDGHDYYMLSFRTSDRRLARALRRLGLRPTGDPKVLASRMAYSLSRGSSPTDTVPEETVADTARPVSLQSSARVTGGVITADLASPIGLFFRKTVTPYDVREWFVRPDCKVVSVFEHKERPTAQIPTVTVTMDPGTLAGRLVDKAPDSDGRLRVASSTDVFVQFDEVMTFTLRDLPEPAVPAGYDAVRERTSAAGGPEECKA